MDYFELLKAANLFGSNAKVDLSDYYTKDETTKAISDSVAKIVANAPEDFDTLKEISDWITSHASSAALMNSQITTLQTGKVDKVAGKTLSTNDFTTAEKTKLSKLTNYDDTSIKASVATKVDKVDGKSLIADSEIERLAGVSNYNDTALKDSISKEIANLAEEAAERRSADSGLQSSIDDTQTDVAANTRDIGDLQTTLAEEAAYRRAAVGDSFRNIFNPIVSNVVKNGITLATAEDGKITVSGTTTAAYSQDLTARDIFPTGRPLRIRRSEVSSGIGYNYAAFNDSGSTVYKSVKPTEDTVIPATWKLRYIYLEQRTVGTAVNLEFYPLIQDADIKDTSFVPYRPSLQEQIDALRAMIQK